MKEKTIKIAGKDYKITAISSYSVTTIHDEWRKNAPDPVKELVATAADLPEGMREAFIKDNIAEAHREKRQRASFTSEEFRNWLHSKDGAQRMAREMFRKYHGNLTDEACFDLIGEAISEHGEAAFAELFSDKPAKPAKHQRS